MKCSDNVLESFRPIELFQFQLKTTGFDLAQVQYVVNQVQQMPPISKNVVDESQLLISERTLQPFAKQLRETNDRMQGCSKLVTHARQEFALELVCCFHLTVSKLQLPICRGQFSGIPGLESADLFFCLYPVGDISDNRSDPKSLLGFKRAETDLNGESCSVLALALQQQTAPHRTR